MGYYTSHTLTWERLDSCQWYASRIKSEIAKAIKEDAAASDALNPDELGASYGEVKWYDCDDWVETLSDTVRDVEFCVDCQGEDGERWRHYALNGKAVRVEPIITWPKPDYEGGAQ